MANGSSPELIFHIKNFTASEQTQYFQDLQHNQFSGQVVFQDLHQTKWTFFFDLGKVIYATGGRHPVRRWRRNLVCHLPQIAQQLSTEIKRINLETETEIWLSWDYHLLSLWLKQQKITTNQVVANINALVGEVLFELAQAPEVSCQLQEKAVLSWQPLARIDIEVQILNAGKAWSKWQELGLQTLSPNAAPWIIDLEKLQANTTETTFLALNRLIDGKRSIRDLAVKKQSHILTFMRSLNSFIDMEAIGFKEISDLPYPLVVPQMSATEVATQAPLKTSESNNQAKVACISHNKLLNQQLNKITEKLNYNLLNITDYVAAIGTILEIEPNLILIDIELPESSGYEICTQLRKLEYLSHIPIILCGRSVSLMERMKAKMAGASETFEISMNVTQLLRTVERYRILSQVASTDIK